MGSIYSSCGELEDWLGELLDCCSFSSYAPAKSLSEIVHGSLYVEICLHQPGASEDNRNCLGSREVKVVFAACAALVSKKYYLFVEMSWQPYVLEVVVCCF